MSRTCGCSSRQPGAAARPRRGGVPGLPLAERRRSSCSAPAHRLEPEPAVEELCRRLDNMPLALELAAARDAALSPRADPRAAVERLDLLQGRPRRRSAPADAPRDDRVVATTYSPRRSSALFARLAVFAGGCALEAAEEVADADLERSSRSSRRASSATRTTASGCSRRSASSPWSGSTSAGRRRLAARHARLLHLLRRAKPSRTLPRDAGRVAGAHRPTSRQHSRRSRRALDRASDLALRAGRCAEALLVGSWQRRKGSRVARAGLRVRSTPIDERADASTPRRTALLRGRREPFAASRSELLDLELARQGGARVSCARLGPPRRGSDTRKTRPGRVVRGAVADQPRPRDQEELALLGSRTSALPWLPHGRSTRRRRRALRGSGCARRAKRRPDARDRRAPMARRAWRSTSVATGALQPAALEVRATSSSSASATYDRR